MIDANTVRQSESHLSETTRYVPSGAASSLRGGFTSHPSGTPPTEHPFVETRASRDDTERKFEEERQERIYWQAKIAEHRHMTEAMMVRFDIEAQHRAIQ